MTLAEKILSEKIVNNGRAMKVACSEFVIDISLEAMKQAAWEAHWECYCRFNSRTESAFKREKSLFESWWNKQIEK